MFFQVSWDRCDTHCPQTFYINFFIERTPSIERNMKLEDQIGFYCFLGKPLHEACMLHTNKGTHLREEERSWCPQKCRHTRQRASKCVVNQTLKCFVDVSFRDLL